MTRLITAIASTAMALLITACSSVPMGTPEKDAELKQFTAPKEAASVFIYRNELMAPGIRMDVLIDGIEIGSTVAKTFLHSTVKPGKHTITSKAEDNHSIEIDAPSGGVVYVWQEVKMGGWYARSKLKEVDEKTGQAGVNECRLSVR